MAFQTAKLKFYFKTMLGATGSTVVATSTESTGDFSVDYLFNWLESKKWKAEDAGIADPQYITFDAGATKTKGADYLAIIGHNFDTAGATVTLEYSSDNFSGDVNDAFSDLISSFATSVFDAAATNPAGITEDANGTLWIIDNASDKIYNVQTDGTLISSFATSVFDASATISTGISYDSNGTLWVIDLATDKIYNIQTDGTLISSFATSVFDAAATNPTDVAKSINGTLWVVDSTTNKIYNVQTDGTLISSFATSVFDASATSTSGLSESTDCTLWISDFNTDKIYNVQTDGTLISSFSRTAYDVTASVPQGVGFAVDGTVWIVDAQTDKVYNVRPNTNGNDKLILKEFDMANARYWRLKITGHGATAPFMSIAVWGEKTEIDFIQPAFDPDSIDTNANVNLSQGGFVTGIHTKSTERQFDIALPNSSLIVYETIKKWRTDHGLKNFFMAWDTEGHGLESYLVRPDGGNFTNPVNVNQFRDVQLRLVGRKE